MILSFDIGIKNLSYCLLDNKKTIHDWGIINMCGEDILCNQYTKKNCVCNKKACYYNGVNNYCKTHIKSSKVEIAPTYIQKIIKTNKIPKSNYKKLQKIFTELEVDIDKINMEIDLITKLLLKKYYFPIIPSKKAKSISLVDIGCFFKNNIAKIFNIHDISCVLIENQLSARAVRMRTIQGMLTQYFICNGIENIKYISSQNKLKNYDVPKKTYSERKKSGINIVSNYLKTNKSSWECFYENHKKKDDLADCYLQAIYYIDN